MKRKHSRYTVKGTSKIFKIIGKYDSGQNTLVEVADKGRWGNPVKETKLILSCTTKSHKWFDMLMNV